MIVDAHYHLEEQLESVDLLLSNMQQNNIDRVALIPRINEPFHLQGLAKKAGELLPKLLMSNARPLGLLLYNSTVTADGRISTLGTKHLLYHEPDNTYVDDVLQAYPDKFFGWIFVNPKVTNALEEVERWVGRPGWVGVKSHPFWHNYSISMLDDIGAFCADKDMPILIHLGSSRGQGDYRFLPDRHPKLKIIYAHASVPLYKEAWTYIKQKENVFVDLSNPVYVDERILPQVVEELGAQKCLYATDGPYLNATHKRMLPRILRLPISDRERERILSENFYKMVGSKFLS